MNKIAIVLAVGGLTTLRLRTTPSPTVGMDMAARL
jgi:hypothetical protein